MTAACVIAALALLVWPSSRSTLQRRRRRLFRPEPRPAPIGGRAPLPLLAGGVATVGAAALSTPLVAVLTGTLAVLWARAWRAGGRAAAEEAGVAGLLDALGALTADLRSGRPLEAAARAASAARGGDECGHALVQAVRTEGHPSAVPPALVEPLTRVAAAVRLSARTGCSLAEVLTAVEDDLRARGRSALELRSATAGPRAGALLLAGLPALGLAMGSGVGADPWRVLTATGTGQLLLVGGVALEVAGVVWSGRLVRRALR